MDSENVWELMGVLLLSISLLLLHLKEKSPPTLGALSNETSETNESKSMDFWLEYG